MLLNIVTPCSRPNNIKLMVNSIKTITNMNVLWHICFDSEKIEDIGNIDINHKLYYTKSNNKEISGNKQRNLILKNIKDDGFIFFLDDDNIIHPNFNNILLEVKYGNNYIFTQIFKNNNIRFKPHDKCIYPKKIDTAQILISSCNINEKTIWPVQYYSEYPFIYNVNSIKKFNFIYEIGSYYNYLRSNKLNI